MLLLSLDLQITKQIDNINKRKNFAKDIKDGKLLSLIRINSQD